MDRSLIALFASNRSGRRSLISGFRSQVRRGPVRPAGHSLFQLERNISWQHGTRPEYDRFSADGHQRTRSGICETDVPGRGCRRPKGLPNRVRKAICALGGPRMAPFSRGGGLPPLRWDCTLAVRAPCTRFSAARAPCTRYGASPLYTLFSGTSPLPRPLGTLLQSVPRVGPQV